MPVGRRLCLKGKENNVNHLLNSSKKLRLRGLLNFVYFKINVGITISK